MDLNKTVKIGEVKEIVIKKLKLAVSPHTPIFLGETNLQHMKDRHPEDFAKYGNKIIEIINSPDYITKHPYKESIEYIKAYYDNEEEDHVLVAVRATNSGVIFARTLFVMSKEKVSRYQLKGALKRYNKE